MSNEILSPMFETENVKNDPQWRERQAHAINAMDSAFRTIGDAHSKHHEYLNLAKREMERVRAEKEAIADATHHFFTDVMLMAEEGNDEIDGGFKRAVERLQWKIATYLDPKRFD